MAKIKRHFKKFNDYLNNWYGVPSWFKKINVRRRRHKNNSELRQEKELSTFKKTDSWDWW